MKILCIGDSWTKGYGIENINQTWPHVLQSITGHEVTVVANHGARNEQMLLWAETELTEKNYDLAVIGWSGITRKAAWSLSYNQDEEVDSAERAEFFRTHSVRKLQHYWMIQRRKVEMVARSKKTNVVHFSVFGDDPFPDKFNLLSCLEHLANEEGIYFKHSIPVFEFDFLHENNIVTQEFARRNFDSDWERACVEREEVRFNKHKTLFLDCGHPSAKGHEVWAKYIKSSMNL